MSPHRRHDHGVAFLRSHRLEAGRRRKLQNWHSLYSTLHTVHYLIANSGHTYI
jgi:hypothetical protein